MLTVEVPVVRGEHHQGVVGHAQLVEPVEQPVDALVHRQQRLQLGLIVAGDVLGAGGIDLRPPRGNDLSGGRRPEVGLLGERLIGELALVTRCGGGRDDVERCVGLLDVVADDARVLAILLEGVAELGVRGEVADVDQPGRVARLTLIDLLEGEVGQHVGLVQGLVVLVVGVDHPVVVDRKPEVAAGRRVDQRPEVVPAGGDLGRIPHAITVEVLADMGGVVARLLQCGGERGVPVLKPGEPTGGQRIPQHSVVVGVLTGVVGGSARATQRIAGDAVGERRALAADAGVDRREHPHGLDRLIVGHDHQQVGLVDRLGDLHPVGQRRRLGRARRCHRGAGCTRTHAILTIATRRGRRLDVLAGGRPWGPWGDHGNAALAATGDDDHHGQRKNPHRHQGGRASGPDTGGRGGQVTGGPCP